MKPEVATRRIKTFGERFGKAHLYLAYHAAFPLALTPDLLYRMWANFQHDINGEALNIPWMAVADLLLSSLCDEVGHELYEMDTAVRNALLKELKGNSPFGEKRVNELSDFLLAYVQQQLDSHDPDIRDFAQVQRWTALAYTQPSEAANKIALALSKLKLEEKAEWVRMTSLVETFAEPLAEFQPLLIYARGMDRFIRGDLEAAVAQLSNLTQQGQQTEIAGIWLNIPKLPLLEAQRITLYWRKRLAIECSEQSVKNRESIISWLLGSDLHRFEVLSQNELDIAKQAMEYRYKILRQRYLGIPRERGYRNLITRLGSLVTLRDKIQTWIALSRDRQRTVLDVLQEVIQELLQSNNYIQQQQTYITELTTDDRLKNALLYASVEEYCLRPVRNQPLLVYRFVNYLRRTQRGGLTQVSTDDLIRLVYEEILTDDTDNQVNLVDTQAIAEYQEAQAAEEQQAVRQTVKQEFEDYLLENLGQEAVEWLRLYIKGKSQDEIAKKLNKPIKEVYQLREKISYHAVRVFALKGKPELVDSWLSISLKEHNLGLTPKQWEQLSEQLTPLQRQVLELRKAGHSIEDTASQLKLKTHQAMGEWTKVYLVAQALRSEE